MCPQAPGVSACQEYMAGGVSTQCSNKAQGSQSKVLGKPHNVEAATNNLRVPDYWPMTREVIQLTILAPAIRGGKQSALSRSVGPAGATYKQLRSRSMNHLHDGGRRSELRGGRAGSTGSSRRKRYQDLSFLCSSDVAGKEGLGTCEINRLGSPGP